MIDKNKAYRFKGDSERWTHECDWWWCGDLAISKYTADHLHSRGLLLEYPELPGDDWEFCEIGEQEMYWVCYQKIWLPSRLQNPTSTQIYCRKKKPVYRSGCCTIIERTLSGQPFPDEVPIYWTTDPVRGKELLK